MKIVQFNFKISNAYMFYDSYTQNIFFYFKKFKKP